MAESTGIFNEDSLRAAIVDRWGEYGAHVEVFDHMLGLARQTDLDRWKTVAAKLAYLVAKRDCPDATEDEVEKIAAGMLVKVMEIEASNG